MEEFTNEHISALLLKKIIGSLSPEEETELETWRDEAEPHRRLYKQITDHQHVEQLLRQRDMVNTERPLADMNRRIAGMHHHPATAHSWRRWAAAASLLALVASGTAWMWHEHSAREQREVAVLMAPQTGRDIVPGQKKGVLTLPDGRQIALGDKAGKDEPSLLDRALARLGGTEKQLCLDIPRGGEFKVVLEDSTEVWLNSESRLVYPEHFADNERCVTVSGEAYFKVTHDSKRPFRVETDGQMVTVHGTEFNVKSYKEDTKVYTTLVEGSISLRRKDGSGEVMLQPNHQSLFDKTDATTNVRTVNADVVTSWRYGKFIFENQTLEEIMQELSRWYSFDYEFAHADLKKIEFMGSIPRYAKFATALAILENCGGIHFKTVGNKVIINR